MSIFSRKSIHSERNCSTVNIPFLECREISTRGEEGSISKNKKLKPVILSYILFKLSHICVFIKMYSHTVYKERDKL